MYTYIYPFMYINYTFIAFMSLYNVIYYILICIYAKRVYVYHIHIFSQ